MKRVDLSSEIHVHLAGNRRLRRIRFDPAPHKYYVVDDFGSYQSNFISVTSVISRLFPKFNPIKTARRIVSSTPFRRGHKKYLKYIQKHGDCILTDAPDDAAAKIARGWKEEGEEAAALGSAMHEDCENFYNHRPVNDPDSKEHLMFLEYNRYMEGLGYEPFATELMVYGGGISGAIDMLYRHSSSGRVVLRDWKRSKKISTYGFGAKALYSVFEHLPPCNFTKYSLQLNLYAEILRRWYSIDIFDMAIVVLHPNNPSFVEKKIPRLEPETAELFKFRRYIVATQRVMQTCTLALLLHGVLLGTEQLLHEGFTDS
jgi:hypothetical protein